MNLWLKTRRTWVLVVCAGLCTVGEAFLSDGHVPAPVAVGLEGRVLWSTFLPLVWVAGIVDVLASKAQGVEVRAGRRLEILDAVVFVLVCLTGAGIAAWASGNAQSPLGAAGNVLVLMGLAAWVTLHWGPGAGVLAASALMVLTMVYGIRAPLGPYVRVLQPDGHPGWTFALGVVLCAGVVSTILYGSGRAHLRSGADVFR